MPSSLRALDKFLLRHRVFKSFISVVCRHNQLWFDIFDKLQRADGINGVTIAANWHDQDIDDTNRLQLILS